MTSSEFAVVTLASGFDESDQLGSPKSRRSPNLVETYSSMCLLSDIESLPTGAHQRVFLLETATPLTWAGPLCRRLMQGFHVRHSSFRLAACSADLCLVCCHGAKFLSLLFTTSSAQYGCFQQKGLSNRVMESSIVTAIESAASLKALAHFGM